MKMQETMLELKAVRDEASALRTRAASENRDMTAAENSAYNAKAGRALLLEENIREAQGSNTLFKAVGGDFSKLLTGGGAAAPTGTFNPLNLAATRNPEYARAVHAFVASGGKALSEDLMAGADGFGGFRIPGSELYSRQRYANGGFSAATYEGTPQGGSTTAGGYAVSVPTLQQVAPLALPDLGIFDASMVIPTTTAMKIPQQTAFGTSALKAESTSTIATFGGTDPTLGQVELDAWMVGAVRIASWELLQDVQFFQQFLVDDLLKAQRILEGQLLASGTASSQPQGVFGNTGTGTGTAYQLTGAAADATTLLNSLFDVTATLKGPYQANACWIMSRATGLAIRRAQMQTNLFAPVVTTDPDGTERILGKPVFYDVNAPSLPTATSSGVLPILYGDFKAGYIVGVRGGEGVNVKILDQPLATQGQLAILAYRRIDAKVRLSESIQAVKISHS